MSSAVANRRKYRPDIDGLRTVAVLAVVVFHAFPRHLPGGFVGVDIFFVISGYLITGIIIDGLENGERGLADFYLRRIQRIFPALATVLLTCLILGVATLRADELEHLGYHTFASATFFENILLYSESGYFDADADTKPLLHLWSLAIEEQFYLIWPVLLMFRYERRRAFWVLSLVVATSFGASLALMDTDPSAAFFLPFSRFWELAAGGLLAVSSAENRMTRVLPGNLLSLAGATLVGASIFILTPQHAFPGWWALLPVSGTCMLLAAGRNAWLNKHALSVRPMVAIGLISYPLYLWHWPLLYYAQTLVVTSDGMRLVKLAALFSALVLAWMTYYLVERPIRRQAPSVRTALRLLVVVAGVGLSGLFVGRSEGLPSRPRATSLSDGVIAEEQATDCLSLGVSGAGEWNLQCRQSAPSRKRTILVFGDSHAWIAFDGLATVFDQQNVIVIAAWGCPLLDGFTVSGPQHVIDRCRNNTAEALQLVDRLGPLDSAILLTRGPYYLHGGLNYTAGDTPPVREGGIDPFVAGLQNTIRRVRVHTQNVYYVTENPELGMEPRKCLPRPVQFGLASCSMQTASVLDWQAQYLAGLSRLNGATVIRGTDIFCRGGACQISAGDGLLYESSDHLSPLGSLYQAHAIKRWVSR